MASPEHGCDGQGSAHLARKALWWTNDNRVILAG
jgi:hypothetical protein